MGKGRRSADGSEAEGTGGPLLSRKEFLDVLRVSLGVDEPDVGPAISEAADEPEEEPRPPSMKARRQ